jgi:hypothetical protein
LTADELGVLNGLLGREAAARAEAGDGRDKTHIVDDLLQEAGGIGDPSRAIEMLRRMDDQRRRSAVVGNAI